LRRRVLGIVVRKVGWGAVKASGNGLDRREKKNGTEE
jgi:hypothetical protein